MDLKEFLDRLNNGETVEGGSPMHQFMHNVSQEALRITAELNGAYHLPEEVRRLFSELTGKTVDESFGLFPPFSRGVILTPLNLSAFPACSALPSPSRSARSARSALACRPGFSDTCSRVTFMQQSQTTDRYGSGT